MKKQAFTLVELIVVITVLSILGLISFISIQGYTRDARDTKRLSDVNNILKKISLERTKGVSLSNFISNQVDISTGLKLGGVMPTDSKQGTVNFISIKEEGNNFKDPKGNDYVLSYALGGVGLSAYKFLQLATINEEKNEAILVGDYYKIQINDSPSIVFSDSTNTGSLFVENKKSILPYSISGLASITCNDGYHEEDRTCISNTRSCIVVNGSGQETWNGSSWESCNVNNCNIGYVNQANQCLNESCNGTTPIGGAISNATSLIGGVWAYNVTPGICTYTCDINYTWDGNLCVANTQIFTCINKPVNTSWNTVSSYTQTWNGILWNPIDSTTEYNISADTETCRYTCAENYHTEDGGTTCIANTNTNQTCTNLPVNALYFNGSTNYSINQTWGGSWLPSVDALLAGYSATPINNTCEWKCNNGYINSGNSCIYTSYFLGNGTTLDPFRKYNELINDSYVEATSCNYYNLNANYLNNGAVRGVGTCGLGDKACLSDGIYLIDTDGVGGNNAFKVYCDMTVDEGGWTLVVRATKANQLHRNTNQVGTLVGPIQSTTYKLQDDIITSITKSMYRMSNDEKSDLVGALTKYIYFDISDTFKSSTTSNSKTKISYTGNTWYGPFTNAGHIGFNTYASAVHFPGTPFQQAGNSARGFIYSGSAPDTTCRLGFILFGVGNSNWCGNGNNGAIFSK